MCSKKRRVEERHSIGILRINDVKGAESTRIPHVMLSEMLVFGTLKLYNHAKWSSIVVSTPNRGGKY